MGGGFLGSQQNWGEGAEISHILHVSMHTNEVFIAIAGREVGKQVYSCQACGSGSFSAC